MHPFIPGQKRSPFGFTLLHLIAIVLFASSCGRNTPEPSTQPAATTNPTITIDATHTLEVTATLSPPATLAVTRISTKSSITPSITPPPNPFRDWPVSVGNKWIYSTTVYYDHLKARYRVVDTVIRNFSIKGDFSTIIERKVEFLDGDRKADYLGNFKVGNNTITINSSSVINKPFVILKFPLENNLNWAHSLNENEQNPVSGKNVWVIGPATKEVINKEHPDCYEIIYQYLSGGISSWFCPGIGFVENIYDHNGTPFGYHEKIIEFYIK